MFGNIDWTKITSQNQLSSTFIVVAGFALGGCLVIFSKNNPGLYSGICILFLMSLLAVHAYFKNSISEHYENIITQKDSIIAVLNTQLKNANKHIRAYSI